jgi:Fic family protein
MVNNMGQKELISADYPWIDYQFDFRKLTFQSWMELGECDSKCEHIAKTPLPPENRQKLHQVYLSKGAHATTAIEGNTLSEDQVLQAVESKLELPKSKEYLKTEVDNIINAVNIIGQRIARKEEPGISPELLCEYNEYVLKGLEVEEGVIPGKYRLRRVGVARYRAPEAKCVKAMMVRLCTALDDFDSNHQLPPRSRAILKAIFAHLYVVWIHPFGDGNGRTARLLEFDILLRSGIPSPAAHLLSNHYNTTRSEYYRRLDSASKARDTAGFLSYAITGFRDNLQEQLDWINGFVRRSVWINYVHERFSSERHTDKMRRLRDVVLAITHSSKPVPMIELPLLLNERYNQKTSKTVTRDIRELLEMSLIRGQVEKNKILGYVANIEMMDSLLPFQRDIEL